MKKLFLTLAFILVTFSLMAQDQVISGFGVKGVTNATASIKTAAYNYTFLVNIPKAFVFSYQVHLDQLTASDNTATVILKGSLDNTNFVALDTISWAGATADTTISYSITSAPLSYKYLRLTITPTDTARVKSIWLNAVPLN